MARRPQDDDERAMAEVQEVEGSIVPREGDTGLLRYIETERRDIEVTGTAAYEEIIAQIMMSATAEEVLTPYEAESLDNYQDRPLRIHTFDLNRSEFDVGSPYYATCRVETLDTGEKKILNTGHQALMAQLIRLQQLDAFPVECTVKAAKRANKYGNYPLRLQQLEV